MQDLLWLSVDCSLCDPINQIAWMYLKHTKYSLIKLLVPDYRFRQLSLHIFKEFHTSDFPGRRGRDSQNSRNQSILCIVEIIQQLLIPL
jgi:hypothetical protein